MLALRCAGSTPSPLWAAVAGQGPPCHSLFRNCPPGQAVNPQPWLEDKFCFNFLSNCSSVASALALVAPAYAGKLAIVIDDSGYRPHYENQVPAMPAAISVAVLLNAPHAREMATKAYKRPLCIDPSADGPISKQR